MKILITGASGYIGGALADKSVRTGIQTLALLRVKPSSKPPYPFLIPSSWDDPALLAKAMEGCHAVVHCAGLAHGKPGDMEETNTRLTETLAQAALKAKVKRFVFLSSAAVFGHEGVHGVDDPVRPVTSYGHSKVGAERILANLFQDTDTRCSIIRPPSVLGRNAPGRSDTVRALAAKKLPLPLGSLTARRSFILLDDLTQLILDEAAATGESAIIHPPSQIASPTEILRMMARLDGLSLRLFPFPAFLLKFASLFLMGKREAVRSLIETHILTPGRRPLDRVV